jgi:holliday junction DNA helicase RuvA
MLRQISGRVVHKQAAGGATVGGVLEVLTGGGFAFQVWVTEPTLLTTPLTWGEDDPALAVVLHTHLVVREDGWTLVGFLQRAERDLFTLMLGAPGVGVKLALSLLSQFPAPELAQLMLTGEVKRLASAKGVGKKMAEKLVVELREKVEAWRESVSHGGSSGGAGAMAGRFVTPSLMSGEGLGVSPETRDEVVGVLEALGYRDNEIYQSLDAAVASFIESHSQGSLASGSLPSSSTASPTTDVLLKLALKHLAIASGGARS